MKPERDSKNDIRANLFDDIYATPAIANSMPKYKMPEGENDPVQVQQIIRDELLLDGKIWQPSVKHGWSHRCLGNTRVNQWSSKVEFSRNLNGGDST